MKNNMWSYIKKANRYEKLEMDIIIEAENEFQQQEPHGIDENDDECPIVFRREYHDGWQMSAYTPNGKPMNGFHESFCRCGECGAIFTWGGEDCMICGNCYRDYSEE